MIAGMRLLVLGGTVFLGRAVARQAIAAGHDVTCAARGASGQPVDGARFIRVDRNDPAGLDAVPGEFDAVVDVARHPTQVASAVRALAGRVGHVTFVSSCSAYADQSTPGQRAGTAPTLPPAALDADPTADAEAYGRCKVTCENLVRDAFDDAFICRAGLIVGPEDPSGRFTYWVRRALRGGEVLAPGDPEEVVQWVDVRDLADWILAAARRRLAGTYDGIGPAVARREFLAGVFGELAPDEGPPTYVSQEFLLAQEVAPWSGPRSVPMWLPLPEYGGFLSRDTAPARDAGLGARPLATTARDTADWLAAGGVDSPVGLTAEEEATLLRDWHRTAAGYTP
jgi:nucleoside-diphosphate-sugar epimerase